MKTTPLILICLVLAIFVAGCTEEPINTEQVAKGCVSATIPTPLEATQASEVAQPTKITEEQFNTSMKEYLAPFGTDAAFGLIKLGDTNSEYLKVFLFSESGGKGTQDQAYYLKNLVNLHPEYLGYTVLIVAPTGNPVTSQLTIVTYKPTVTTLVVQDNVMMTETGETISQNTETYPEVTYAKISDAITTGYFTDDDDKVIFS